MQKISLYLKKLLAYGTSRNGAKKILIFSGIAISCVLLFVAVAYLFVITGLTGPLPDAEELAAIENPQASEVYSADSVLLGRYFIQERSNLTFKEIPKSAIDALLATEDIRFYQHGAIDTRSIGRVFFKSILLRQDASGGGSTLTQQLSKNLYPRRSYAILSLFINKLREMVIAARLEKVYTKDEILALYLNTISFGDNTFGLDAASMRFFSVRASKLSVSQAAVLIGMLKATHAYNPRLFPEQSQNRRNTVLAQMEKYDLLPKASLDSMVKSPTVLHYNSITHHSGIAPYFRDYIREQLLVWCNEYNDAHQKPLHLYTSGLKIYTTLDSRLQEYAEKAVAHQMSTTQKSLLRQWGKSDPLKLTPAIVDNAIHKSSHYQTLQQRGLEEEAIMKIMNTRVPMTILTADGERPAVMSPVDSIRHYLKFLSAGFLAMDPRDGAIRAYVGGINHEYFQFDHVRASTRRQVGSTFKPIVYAAAIEKGARPCDFISAEKTTYTNMEDWAPRNSEENYGLKYSMPGALAFSVNTVSVRVLEKGGINNTINLARHMGITSPLPAVPSLALGSADISMMEMVTAYTGFANQGKVATPFYITSITTSTNDVLASFKPAQGVQALSPATAQLILHMLMRAVNEGTSASLRSSFALQNDIAGKTGTTQSNTDGWFIGITPRLVIGTWVGADLPQIRFQSTSFGQGARTALPVFGEFLQHANADPLLATYTRSHFPALSPHLESKLSCASFKTDTNIIKRIFGTSKKEKKREFGKPKKGLLARIFGPKT